MWGLTGGNQPVLQKSVDDWNKANPDKSIKLDFFANDAYKTKVRTAVGAGEGPTFIYGWGGGVLKSYVDAGQVDDLSSFVKDNPKVKDRYLPSVLKNGVVDGKTYALPNNNVQPVVLYFNKQLFEKVEHVVNSFCPGLAKMPYHVDRFGGGHHGHAHAAGKGILSPREHQVVELLASGSTGEEVAERLGISPATVRVHVRNATGKLGANTRTQAVAIAVARGEVAAP